MAKNGNGSGRTPEGQTSRGFPASESRNPKNNATRRPEHIGNIPGDGGAALSNDSDMDSLSDGYPATPGGNSPNRGDAGSIPNPDAVINRGYAVITPGNAPQVRQETSANRSLRGIDPGTAPQPNGDTRKGPNVPKFGTGTNGE